jgi:ribosomal protein S13
MKFEHILQIYWTKGFFFGGKLFYFDQTLNDLMYQVPGLGKTTKKRFIQRFELTHFVKDKSTLLVDHQNTRRRVLLQPLNVIFSQINSVNNRRDELHRLNIIRLYLTRTHRGRSHALGKPVRGQRTWSNAWNSYNLNRVLRNFISETRRLMRKNAREEKINYKMVKKKYATNKTNKKKALSKKKVIVWF